MQTPKITDIVSQCERVVENLSHRITATAYYDVEKIAPAVTFILRLPPFNFEFRVVVNVTTLLTHRASYITEFIYNRYVEAVGKTFFKG